MTSTITPKRTAEVREITPEYAAKLLERNRSNRRLRPHRVDAYAADMLGSAA